MDEKDIHLLDLPNEILIMILKKLDNIDVLYSLLHIKNHHLQNLVQSNIFTNSLNFITKSSTGDDCSISNDMINRFCDEILPQIGLNVRYLIVEPLSMKRVLLATDYPNLTKLKLYNFREEILLQYLTDTSPLRHILKTQITDLVLINTDKYNTIKSLKTYTTNVYAYILIYFDQLKHLTILPSSTDNYPPLSLCDLPSTMFSSSNLIQLSMNVFCFKDCLFLLDGHLQQLSKLHIKISSINSFSSTNQNTVQLPTTLKHFSLTCYDITNAYDDQIVPLLRRMLFLEELTLYLRVRNRDSFIDGTHLHHDILLYMPRLKSFIFYISTINTLDGFVRYVSDEDLQRTFTNLGYHQVTCIVNYFRSFKAISHVYSLPFTFDRLEKISNRFPPMIFHHVTYLKVYDVIPFKHEFFYRVAQAFPLLKDFCIMNYMPQPKENLIRTTMEYPRLSCLDIKCVHMDYIEQFLMDEKAHVPNLIELKINYDQLKMVTDNFTRESTRKNCANVKRLITEDTLIFPNEVYAYFPSIEK